MQQATYFSSPEGYGTHAEANELPGMVVLTTKESLDVVWVLISSLSQETCNNLSLIELPRASDQSRWLLLFKDTRAGSDVLAAAPHLQTSFGLSTIPFSYISFEDRRLGEEWLSSLQSWGLGNADSVPNSTLPPEVFHPTSSAFGPLTAQLEDEEMDTDEAMISDIAEEADDGSQEEANTSTSSIGSNPLFNLSSDDEEEIARLESILEACRESLVATRTLASDVHEGLVAQQAEQEPELLTNKSLEEEVEVRES